MNSLGAVHFDTAEFATGEREAAVRDTIGNGTIPLDIEHLRREGQGIDLQFSSAPFGQIAVQSLRSSATAFTRTDRLVRHESPPSVGLAVQRSGISSLVQEGREAVFGPGEVVLVSSTQPSVILAGHHSQAHLVQIPAPFLAVPAAALRQAVAVRLNADLPIAGVLGRLVDDLATLPDLPPAEAAHLARPVVELVRALIATVAGDSRRARGPLDATLQLRVRDYLQTHWRERDLTASRIAAAHHISTRQLYRLLAAEGISLGGWLRAQRLEACRDELARPGAVAGTVASVGRRWGFPDATNFGRAFKAAYGLTPLDWRVLHQPARH